MKLVSDAPDACRMALGMRLAAAEPADLDAPSRWAAATFLDAGRPVWRVPDRTPVVPSWNGPIVVAERAAGSQFVRLQELLASDEEPGGGPVPDVLACVALAGSRFRGQRGRTWATLRGNLHLSVHLQLDLPAKEAQAALAVLPAVAASRAVECASDGIVRPGLKWVNDLLLRDRKIGGVLSASHVESGRVRHLLLGIGLNVAATPDLPASPRALPAGRLADVDARFAGPDAWGRLLGPLLDEIALAGDRLAAGRGGEIVDAYRERAVFLGRRVTIWPVDEPDDGDATPIARGRVEALLPDLSLRLVGRSEPVRRGRMTLDDEPLQDVGPVDSDPRPE